MRLAAIDIGSNAARLLISEVTELNGQTSFLKLNLIRIPLRLGFDVFEYSRISVLKEEMILKTIKAYKHLMEVYNVNFMIACATSAMRDAQNGEEIIERVKKETGIAIEIISGNTEAGLIYENHIAENKSNGNSYLYIDVGGGSTEISIYQKGKLTYKNSFNIGTIRILKNQVTDNQWDEMRTKIKQETNDKSSKMIAIGSGGNINKVFSLSKKKEDKPLHIEALRNYHKELSSVDLRERMQLYKLKEDRADVIIPALLIYINVMKWAGVEEILVPKIGLADGLIANLYEKLTLNAQNKAKT